MGLNAGATERTSAQSKPPSKPVMAIQSPTGSGMIPSPAETGSYTMQKSKSRKKKTSSWFNVGEHPPQSSDTLGERQQSLNELQSSAAFSSAQNSRQNEPIDEHTAGRMLDSDGFEVQEMEHDDF